MYWVSNKWVVRTEDICLVTHLTSDNKIIKVSTKEVIVVIMVDKEDKDNKTIDKDKKLALNPFNQANNPYNNLLQPQPYKLNKFNNNNNNKSLYNN